MLATGWRQVRRDQLMLDSAKGAKDRVLTQARAMVVRNYLVENFKLDDTRIKTMGNKKSAELNQASRVEILVYPPGISRALAQTRSLANRQAGARSQATNIDGLPTVARVTR